MATYNYYIKYKDKFSGSDKYEINPLQASNRNDLIYNLKETLEEIFNSEDPDFITEVTKISSTGEYIPYDWQTKLKKHLKGLEKHIERNNQLVKEVN